MDEKYPQRPEGTATGEGTASSPRIEIEPTPQAPQGAAPASAFPTQPTVPQTGNAQAGSPRAGAAQTGAHAAPSGASWANPSGTAGQAQPTQHYAAPQAAAGAGTSAAGRDPRSSQAPSAPAETVTHTVVKTKTKKLPVFVSSLAGLVVGAVLVIALVMTGALRIGSTFG